MSADETDKPTGTGYALIEWRLARIEAQLLTNSSDAVPVGIYNMAQQVMTEKLAELMRLHLAEQATRERNDLAVQVRIDASEKKAEENQQAIEKARKQFWLTVAAGILVTVVNIFGNPLAQTIIGLMSKK